MIIESVAILYHIAIRSGKRELIGNTDDKFIEVLVAFNVAQDLQAGLSRLRRLREDAEKAKEESFTTGKPKSKLEVLNKNLEEKECCGIPFSC